MEATIDRFGYLSQPVKDYCEKPAARLRLYGRVRHKIYYSDRVIADVAIKEKTLEEWFNVRADSWSLETGFHSNPTIRFMHKDYQTIMARGKEIIPHILNRMKTKPDEWFWALRFLADNYDAASVAGAKSFNEATQAWIKWGIDNNYISE